MTTAKPQQKPSMTEAATKFMSFLSSQQPNDEHNGPRDHDRGEEQLDVCAVFTLLVWFADKGGNDGSKGALGALDHSRPSPEQDPNYADDPCGVQGDGRRDVCHEGKGDGFGDLRKANGDSEQHFGFDKVELFLFGQRVELWRQYVLL